MREGIRYSTKPQQEALHNRILNKILASDCPQNLKDGLTAYSDPIDHPTTNEVMFEIERDRNYWQWFSDVLTPAELSNIKEIGPEWGLQVEE